MKQGEGEDGGKEWFTQREGGQARQLGHIGGDTGQHLVQAVHIRIPAALHHPYEHLHAHTHTHTHTRTPLIVTRAQTESYGIPLFNLFLVVG